MENNAKDLTMLKEQSQAIEAKIKETEAIGQELAATAAQRMAEYKSLLQKQSEEASPAGLDHAAAATEAATKEIRRLAERLPPPLASDYAQGLQQMVAYMEQMANAVQKWADDFPQAGQGPPGTERAGQELKVGHRPLWDRKGLRGPYRGSGGSTCGALFHGSADGATERFRGPGNGCRIGRGVGGSH